MQYFVSKFLCNLLPAVNLYSIVNIVHKERERESCLLYHQGQHKVEKPHCSHCSFVWDCLSYLLRWRLVGFTKFSSQNFYTIENVKLRTTGWKFSIIWLKNVASLYTTSCFWSFNFKGQFDIINSMWVFHESTFKIWKYIHVTLVQVFYKSTLILEQIHKTLTLFLIWKIMGVEIWVQRWTLWSWPT